MEALGAAHLEQIAALRRWHEEITASLQRERAALRAENAEMRLDMKRHERTIADQDRQIYQLTNAGKAYSTEPCSLCGRVGDRYVQEPGENSHNHDRATRGEENQVPANGKPWEGTDGCYRLEDTEVPDYYGETAAQARRTSGSKPEEGDEELLAWRNKDQQGTRGDRDQIEEKTEEESYHFDDDVMEADEHGWTKRELELARDYDASEESRGW